MGDLEKALNLTPSGDGIWLGSADPNYEANTGMYGGTTAALLLKAVMSEKAVIGTPASLNVSYVRLLPPGSAVELRTRLLGSTRSIQHWAVDISVAGSGDISATALVVMGTRRAGDALTELKMPQVAPPEGDVKLLVPPATFGVHSPVRMAICDYDAAVPEGRTYSAGWIREISGRRIDHIQLAYLCDNLPPRAFFLGTGPRPSSTLSYNTYFIAPADEIASLGDDFLLMEATGTRGVEGAFGTRGNLWSRDGRLIATTEQLAWYR